MMRFVLLLLMILINFEVAIAQLPVTSTTSFSNPNHESEHGKNGNYAIDTANERNQYVGLWEYNQNGTLFQVKMEKVDQYLNQGVYNGNVINYNYADVIMFKYRLVKNGVEIYNDLNQVWFPKSYNTSIATKISSANYLYGSFIDQTRKVGGRVSITKLNTTPEKIIFDVSLGGYYFLNPPGYYDDNQPLFTFPTGGIEMVKIQ